MKNQKTNVKAVSCEGKYSKEVEAIPVKEVDKRPKVEFVSIQEGKFFEMWIDGKRENSGYPNQLGYMLRCKFGLRALIDANVCHVDNNNNNVDAAIQYIQHYPNGMLMDDEYTKIAQQFWSYLSGSATSLAAVSFYTYEGYKKLKKEGYNNACSFHFSYHETLSDLMKYGGRSNKELEEIAQILSKV